MKRITILLLAIFCLVAVAQHDAQAARKNTKNQPNNKYASIVIDAATGITISERNADKILHPASLTKMMTLYLTFEALQSGRIRKSSRLTVSSRATEQPPSKLNLQAGSTIRVEDAIYALVTKSANDVAVTVAEGLGGSEARFAQMMTARARQLGARNTNFVNAHGLHNPKQISTARDMAIISRALMRDFPHEYKYFSTPSFTYAGVKHTNHNKLLKTYPGMDGLKTGYIYASGFNLAASAVQDGRRLIGVVFGGRTSASRNAHMVEILDAGFDRLREPQVARRIQQQTQQQQLASADTGTTSLPVRKPVTVAAVTAVDRALASRAETPETQFDALGIVGMQQGDREDGSEGLFIKPLPSGPKIIHNMAPQAESAPVRTTIGQAVWSVQIGAFASHDAGLSALRGVRDRLPKTISAHSQYIIAPLMTSRGVIYRARLSGLSREQATQACRALKDNCLILAAQ